jgi:peptidoglycan/LPS O-acetylase OafA/YrhL
VTSVSPEQMTRRLPSLTGMRFIAAFLVFTTHVGLEKYFGNARVDTDFLRQGLDFGWTGVEFFFILSGFVLTWSASPTDTPKRFWRRRIVKIYPNQLVSWTLALVLALTLASQISPIQFVPSLFLVHTWIPDNAALKSLNLPSWSLCSEVLFYFLFPWLLRLVDRIRPHLLWYAAGATFGLSVLIAVFTQVALPSGDFAPFHMTLIQHWVIYQLPPCRLPDFMLGVIMARIVKSGRWIRIGIPAALGLLVVGCVAQYYADLTVWAPTVPVAIPLALLIAAGATADVRASASVFRRRTMVWLGEVSFAFFMLHYLVVHYTHVLIGVHRSFAPLPAIALILALCLVSVGLAWLLYRFVETPAMRRWSRPRRAPVLERPPASVSEVQADVRTGSAVTRSG